MTDVSVNALIEMDAKDVSTERDCLEEVFGLAIQASERLWAAVAAIHQRKVEQKDSMGLVSELMQTRGDIHVRILRPIYKKYPELASKFGLDEEDHQSGQ